ncbi:putative motility protein [Crenobacter sp. SG2305]|uniref:putative motility protein n=1 Tax=Crenobacter oryzisoli TaxID=3056844 RepID=UPI0025AA98E9|nr:putative motility protein [Crenobacter sp. SG2305]MDN0084629.1 putative motility protein [Crenobacter sp. SG2305]
MDTTAVDSGGSVLDQTAIFAMKKQRDAATQTIGSLLTATTDQMNRNNPAHLGQNIDTTV